MRMLPRDFDGRLLEGTRVLVVPSGIGEFQWMWSKLCNVPEQFTVLALDGAPRRLHQFAQMHPNVVQFGYVGYDYTQIREYQKLHGLTSWERVTSQFPLGSVVMLACNPHLEAGQPLADWLPDLPTRYTYTVCYDQKNAAEATRVLHDATSEDFLVGISCASYRGAAAWRTWEDKEWTQCLTMLQNRFPRIKWVLLGGSWDDLTSSVYDPTSSLRWQLDQRGFPPVGTTTFGGAMRILEKLNAYIGFSSGLGHVAAHLCNTPVAMLWPEHEIEKLATSWVNPDLLKSGRYLPLPWDPVGVIEPKLELFLQKHGA